MDIEENLRDCGQSYVEGGKKNCELNNIHFSQSIVHDSITASVFKVGHSKLVFEASLHRKLCSHMSSMKTE